MKDQASILVVDDEPSNFNVIEMLLLNDGHELIYLSSGLETLNYLEQAQPDLILLDVMMPEMSGIDTCYQIRNSLHLRHIPIIMVTALNAKEDLARCLEAGADDFISKPVSRLELQSRIRSMLRIKQQYDALQATLQLREDMSNMIVHDLRNPLATILLACTILKLTDLQEPQQKKVEQIIIAGQQLQSMVDSLLMLAKLESGRLSLNRTEVDLCAIGTSVIRDFEAIAAQSSIQLDCQLPEPGGGVWVDVSIFRRVLDNLLANAIKFSPAGSQVKLEMEYLPNQRARVQVIDQGRGVSRELRQCIFEKYEIGELIKGITQTGLGLAFCKAAIVAHDGLISVKDNHPRGAIFTIEV